MMTRWWGWRVLLALLWWGALASAAPEVPVGLRPPTSDAYADVALYTLERLVTSAPGEAPGWVEVTLGALHASASADPEALGVYQAVVEIYVDDGEIGFSELLPGSGLRMAPGRGWRDAIRLTHEGAFLWSALRAPEGDRVRLVGMGAPRSLTVLRRNQTLRVELPTPLPAGARVYAISGVHDPFAASGWRALAPSPAPFAFAAEQASRPPIISLLPGDADTYRRVVEGGVLGGWEVWQFRGVPLPAWRLRDWRWWSLCAVGLLLFALGTALARRTRRRRPAKPPVAPLAIRSRQLAGGAPQARSVELIAEDEVVPRA
jgi:hypothetical protein